MHLAARKGQAAGRNMFHPQHAACGLDATPIHSNRGSCNPPAKLLAPRNGAALRTDFAHRPLTAHYPHQNRYRSTQCTLNVGLSRWAPVMVCILAAKHTIQTFINLQRVRRSSAAIIAIKGLHVAHSHKNSNNDAFGYGRGFDFERDIHQIKKQVHVSP
jgi:hypothetical protein